MEAPIPLEAPVTTATFPASLLICDLHFLVILTTAYVDEIGGERDSAEPLVGRTPSSAPDPWSGTLRDRSHQKRPTRASAAVQGTAPLGVAFQLAAGGEDVEAAGLPHK